MNPLDGAHGLHMFHDETLEERCGLHWSHIAVPPSRSWAGILICGFYFFLYKCQIFFYLLSTSVRKE